jgi:hypothetical protein
VWSGGVSANPVPLHLENPLALDEARAAARALAEQRRAAEKNLEDAVETAAQMEADYRRRLAQAFVQTEGTAAAREAEARSKTADDCYRRDLAAGMVKVCTERLRGLEGERAMLRALIDWSMKIEPGLGG